MNKTRVGNDSEHEKNKQDEKKRERKGTIRVMKSFGQGKHETLQRKEGKQIEKK